MRAALAAVSFLALAACGDASALVTSTDPQGGIEASLKGGCRAICPKCRPGQICPLMACTISCPPGRSLCGQNVCGQGEYCCNESCGQCAPAGGACTQQFCGGDCSGISALCIEGTVWDVASCSCVIAP
jgi:hypothetical protein